jgi:hypothetical protein
MMGFTKRWCDNNGHVLGVVVQNGSRLGQLLILREALAAVETVEAVDTLAVVSGGDVTVKCSICGMKRTWYAGEAELERLIRRVKGKRELRIESGE